MIKVPYQVKINDEVILDISGTTAQAGDVTKGKKFYNSNGNLLEGLGGFTAQEIGDLMAEENKIYTPENTGDDLRGILAWNSVTVSVQPRLQEKEASLNSEDQVIVADAGYDGLSSVKVNPIDIYKPAEVMPNSERQVIGESNKWMSQVVVQPVQTEELKVVVNDTYEPPEGYYYNKIVVDVAGAGTKSPEIGNENEMTALLETAEPGSIYKYIGLTGIYETGVLYIVEEGE